MAQKMAIAFIYFNTGPNLAFFQDLPFEYLFKYPVDIRVLV